MNTINGGILKLLFPSLVIFTLLLEAKYTPKIVGLVPIKNESNLIPLCLRSLARCTDAIVVLDDASTDNTLQVVETLKHECSVAKIIKKASGKRDEPGDRNILLKAGRAIGGTHFIVIDGDEMLSANLHKNNYLRTRILSLKPKESIGLNWIQLWKNIHFYRFLNEQNEDNRSFIFCDTQKAQYVSDFIHTSRIPLGINGRCHRIPLQNGGLVHFAFVNPRNFFIKKVWYMCLEFIRGLEENPKIEPTMLAQKINKDPNYVIFDLHKFDSTLKIAKPEWFDYPFFDQCTPYKDESWRKAEILKWFNEYGRSFFKYLDIWQIPIEDL